MIDFNYLNNKKILITGATGLVGFNLIKKIKNNCNCDIHINYLNKLNKNFKDLDESLTHHQFDITNSEEIAKLDNFDIIFYCSGYGQPQKFCNNPEKTFLLNTLSIIDLSKKINENGKFIFISTSEIYADSNENHEEAVISINPNNSRNCYTLSKFFGEIFLSLSSKNIQYKNIRLCLAYGEGFKHNDERVLCEFIIKAIDNKKINLLDDGSGIRSYIYIDDCINALLNIANNSKYNLYNIGGKNLITIKELANKISKLTGCELKFGEKNNKLKNSPDKACVDITRYEEEFGVLNKTDFNDGLLKSIEWYQNYE
jgi:UDP-glucuronate decarboxylase